MKTEFIKKIPFVILFSFVITLIFGVYLVLIGIPKTQARNYYILATQQKEEGDLEKTKEYLQQALKYWDEEYIRQELSSY